MKIFFLAITSLLVSSGFAQITVTNADFPIGGDTVLVSTSDETTLDIVTTGANSVWDYSNLNIVTQRIDTFFDIASAPALYQLVFNNGFTNADYESDYYTPWNGVDFGAAGGIGLAIETPVQFTKVETDKVEITGIGLVANGVSIPAQSDTIDVQYDLPMNYSDGWVSNSYTELDLNPTFNGIYRRHQQRNAIVDGWGQITTPFKTYDALRVKALISSQDSLYIDLGFGGTWIELPVPDQIEYRWFAIGEKIPVLTIITQDLAGTETITTVEFKDKDRDFATVIDNDLFGALIYPNPATTELNISLDKPAKQISIFDIAGKLVFQKSAESITKETLMISEWKAGMYMIQILDESSVSTAKFEVK